MCISILLYFRAMFTDGLRESSEREIELNGVTATGLKNLIDFAYSSKILLDFGNSEYFFIRDFSSQFLGPNFGPIPNAIMTNIFPKNGWKFPIWNFCPSRNP